MRFPPSLLDEIRARLPVTQVVGKRVQLKKAGREWKGLSPFNAEKTPSFYVNDQKGFYHCFSSGKHGDIFDFVMETEGVPFPDVVERLAAEAGVMLPKSSPEAVVQEKKRADLYEICDIACRFFEAQLKKRMGLDARDYLQKRGLTEKTIEEFRIGYAGPERFALRDHLAAKDVPTEAMIEAGLLTSGEGIAVPYDRFRERILFPIQDPKGRVIAFGGRAMRADMPAKYLNSPETPLFHKGRTLYNLHRARKIAHEKSQIIAVEGYVDAIMLAKSGFGQVVAPLGTALTEDQLRLMWRMWDEPILCFDGDAAGQRAAFRALDVALPLLEPGKSLRVALLPSGQDPDDLIRSSGPVAFARIIEAARPLIDMLWMRESESAPQDTPERRAAFEARLRAALGLIKHESVRRYYREAIDERLGPRRFSRPFFKQGYRPQGPLKASPLLAGTALFSGSGTESPREAFILCALVHHAETLPDMAEALAELELKGPVARRLCSLLLDHIAAGKPTDHLHTHEAATKLKSFVRPGDRWACDSQADSVKVEDALRQAFALHRKAGALHRELREAQVALSSQESEANLSWLRGVQAEISSIEGAEIEAQDSSA